jgi:hypothetical protein
MLDTCVHCVCILDNLLPGRKDLNGCFESRIGLPDISLGGHDLVRARLAWLLSSGLA